MKSIKLFEKYSVLSERELRSRYEVYMHTYKLSVDIEAHCMLTMAQTMIAPAVLRYQGELARDIKSVDAVEKNNAASRKAWLVDISGKTHALLQKIHQLDKQVEAGKAEGMLHAMVELRATVDALESMMPAECWPLPSYAEMMFRI
jgi:glutamine synthetase